jgi:hypothetical protein
LVYSLIMLNTDLHSLQIKNKLSMPNWQRNLQGKSQNFTKLTLFLACNNGGNFPIEFLTDLYNLVVKYPAVQFNFTTKYEGEVELFKKKWIWMKDNKKLWARVENGRFQCFSERDSAIPVIDLDMSTSRFTVGDVNILLFEENEAKYEFKVNDVDPWKSALYTNALPQDVLQQSKRILKRAYFAA